MVNSVAQTDLFCVTSLLSPPNPPVTQNPIENKEKTNGIPFALHRYRRHAKRGFGSLNSYKWGPMKGCPFVPHVPGNVVTQIGFRSFPQVLRCFFALPAHFEPLVTQERKPSVCPIPLLPMLPSAVPISGRISPPLRFRASRPTRSWSPRRRIAGQVGRRNARTCATGHAQHDVQSEDVRRVPSRLVLFHGARVPAVQVRTRCRNVEPYLAAIGPLQLLTAVLRSSARWRSRPARVGREDRCGLAELRWTRRCCGSPRARPE